MKKSIKLLIVDDHPVFRQGLRDLFETDSRFEIVGEAADGEVALQQTYTHRPDVVLMDINLPTENGLQVTKKIRSRHPKVKVIMITGYDDAEQAIYAFQVGASAYCSKDIPPEALINTVIEAYKGNFVVNNRVMNDTELAAWLDSRMERYNKAGGKKFVPLSSREMEVLEMVTNGLNNKDVATSLGISHQTVKNHMTTIMRKLQVNDRTQAAVYAIQHGWIRLENNN
ncbi:MAG: response regulator transcription factor [Anaerolineales bacterium]|nr:response regulator transcription factor [Anaerolineales bacterium]